MFDSTCIQEDFVCDDCGCEVVESCSVYPCSCDGDELGVSSYSYTNGYCTEELLAAKQFEETLDAASCSIENRRECTL